MSVIEVWHETHVDFARARGAHDAIAISQFDLFTAELMSVMPVWVLTFLQNSLSLASTSYFRFTGAALLDGPASLSNASGSASTVDEAVFDSSLTPARQLITITKGKQRTLLTLPDHSISSIIVPLEKVYNATSIRDTDISGSTLLTFDQVVPDRAVPFGPREP